MKILLDGISRFLLDYRKCGSDNQIA
jgi:hypothetical protein